VRAERYFLFCKGADSIIEERLADTKQNEDLKQLLQKQLSQFANEGLRTLLLAQKELDTQEYKQWETKYN